MTLALLADRPAGITICPSEVARAMCRETQPLDTWRDAMPAVHKAVDRLMADGEIQLSWKGQLLPLRVGPYRIARHPRR